MTADAKEAAFQKYTETSMNPGLKGREMRKAFDSGDYHVMIVAQKFQTGFDQPKLCAMYVDKTQSLCPQSGAAIAREDTRGRFG